MAPNCQLYGSVGGGLRKRQWPLLAPTLALFYIVVNLFHIWTLMSALQSVVCNMLFWLKYGKSKLTYM